MMKLHPGLKLIITKGAWDMNKKSKRMSKKVWVSYVRIKRTVFKGPWYRDDLDDLIPRLSRNLDHIKCLMVDCKKTENPPEDIINGDYNGYYSLESIMHTLSYISDRFFCYNRLKWLLDLPENYRKLKGEG